MTATASGRRRAPHRPAAALADARRRARGCAPLSSSRSTCWACCAFLWPFLLPRAPGREREPPRRRRPVILLVLLVCLGARAVRRARARRARAEGVALHRRARRRDGRAAPAGVRRRVQRDVHRGARGGERFGPAFGFLLGAVGTFASGLFIGGPRAVAPVPDGRGGLGRRWARACCRRRPWRVPHRRARRLRRSSAATCSAP